MKNVLVFLILCVVVTQGQVLWTQRAQIRHHTKFFSEVIQETVYELEKRGFSSLTLLNITHNVNLPMYKFHVNGTANYTNGFLVSMQKMDVTSMTQSINIPTVDGVPTPRATTRGILNWRDVKLGYDVTFYAVNGDVHTFTGDITHGLISWDISIVQDITTKEITVFVSTGTLSGTVRMVYRPVTSLTEVLSRTFLPSHNSAGIRPWLNIIEPIILDVVKNKVPFPDICYSHC